MTSSARCDVELKNPRHGVLFPANLCKGVYFGVGSACLGSPVLRMRSYAVIDEFR